MKKPYVVSQPNRFQIMIYANGPKEAATKIAKIRLGDRFLNIRATQKVKPTTYKVVLAGSKRTAICYYDVLIGIGDDRE